MNPIEHHALAVTIETRLREHGTRHRDRMREDARREYQRTYRARQKGMAA